MTTTPTFVDNAVADIPLSVDEFGVIRIGDSGVPLESVMTLYRDGATAEEIADSFTSLDQADLHYVLGFALRHRSQIDAYLSNRAVAEAKIRQQVESQFDVTQLKARVQQRRQARELPGC